MASGHLKPFAVLGHPIGHSLSPVMHNRAMQDLGMDAVYLALDVHPDKLLMVLEAMAAMGFGGVNLTIPLKEVAFKGLSNLDESAQLLGAVNTVAFTETGCVGYNTDGYGFLEAVREAFNREVAGVRMLVLGAGGAGRAVALTAARAGAAAIGLTDISHDHLVQVQADIQAAQSACSVELFEEGLPSAEAVQGYDLVVQATPVGMREDDASLLPGSHFREGQQVFDLIYMYPQTAIMKAAEAGGARAANGLGMLLHQGARAFEIWTGQKPPVDAMRTALEKVVYA
jgi:shikimate dehydrogenase